MGVRLFRGEIEGDLADLDVGVVNLQYVVLSGNKRNIADIKRHKPVVPVLVDFGSQIGKIKVLTAAVPELEGERNFFHILFTAHDSDQQLLGSGTVHDACRLDSVRVKERGDDIHFDFLADVFCQVEDNVCRKALIIRRINRKSELRQSDDDTDDKD